MKNKKIRTAIVSTVSQSKDSLIRFCEYHRAVGIDRIILFFDNADEFREFEPHQDERVTCINCDARYWLSLGRDRPDNLDARIQANRMHGIGMCQEQGVEFVAGIDGDELLYASGNLNRTIASEIAGLDAVMVLPYEAVHDRDSIGRPIFEARHFKVIPNRVNRHAVPLFYRHIHDYTDNGFLGHTAGKAIIRTDAGIVAYENSHRPRLSDPSRIAKTYKMKLLHFDCANESEWISKWEKRLDGRANAGDRTSGMRGNRLDQLAQIGEAMENGKDSINDLYEAYHLYSSVKLFFGKLIGLIKKIELKHIDR